MVIDAARALYRTAVEENVELSRLWQQHAHDSAESVKEESLARHDWMRQASQLQDQVREVLLVSRRGDKALHVHSARLTQIMRCIAKQNVLSDMTDNQEKYSNDATQVLQRMRQAGVSAKEQT